MQSTMLFAMTGAAAALVAASARADVVTIGPAKDNTLYDSPTGALSNGSGQHFFAGTTGGGGVRRGLIAFDVGANVPEGATIDNVTLRLIMSRTPGGPADVSLHVLLADWGEGASDAGGGEGRGTTALDGDATWIHTFYDDRFWMSPGGDFDAAPSATLNIDQPGLYEFQSPQMAADVQAWLDGDAPNHGWLLQGDESRPATNKRFDSRDNPDQGRRPSLIVEFTPGCPCDVNRDGDTDRFDLMTFVQRWIAGDAEADYDDSGAVDVHDLLAFLACWRSALRAPCP